MDQKACDESKKKVDAKKVKTQEKKAGEKKKSDKYPTGLAKWKEAEDKYKECKKSNEW